MSDFEEVAEELLACARYGELLEIKQILSTVRSKNWKEEQINNLVNYKDAQGSTGKET